MALVSLSPDDVPPVTNNDSDDIAPLRCEVDGCNNTLTYAGRGRRPTRCEEHKRNKPSANPRQGKGWAKGDEVERALTRVLKIFGAGVAWVNPKDGTIIAKGGPAVSRELVNLARAKKDLRPYLEWLAAPGVYGPLVMALATIVLPIMANHKLLPQLIIPMLDISLAEDEEQKGGVAA